MSDLVRTVGAKKAQALRARACGEFTDGLSHLRAMLDEGGKSAEIAGFAHKLAGAAGLMGMRDLHSALIAVETSAAARATDEIGQMLGEVEREIERLS